MIFTPELGKKFELVSDAFLETLKAAQLSAPTKVQLSVDALWAQTWKAIDNVPD